MGTERTRFVVGAALAICGVAAWIGWTMRVEISCGLPNRFICEYLATNGNREALEWLPIRELKDYDSTRNRRYLYKYFVWLRLGSKDNESFRVLLKAVLDAEPDPKAENGNYYYEILEAAAEYGDPLAVATLARKPFRTKVDDERPAGSSDGRFRQ